MSQDLMNYEQMTQLALRGVVRDAIRRVIREDGLPGAHHFYITFLTRYPGVEIDESLSKKYPEEITIVLEHQFWDLNAYPDEFEVTLKFGGIPKYLKVPYHAITRFHDPSVGFALQFDAPDEMRDEDQAAITKMAMPKGKKKKTDTAKAKNKTEVDTSDSANTSIDENTTEEKTASDETKVVSLDSFRKK